MTKTSAGLLIYRMTDSEAEVLLVHPGGPFWAKKDEGAWSIPKGLVEDDEEPLDAAIREAQEELGVAVDGDFSELGRYRQPGGKIVLVWAVEAEPDVDLDHPQSSPFQMEWPPRSGRMQSFPEVDRAGWFDIAAARTKILIGQKPMLDDLLTSLGKAKASG
jgi:Predicted NTP pyrophosphohydrolase